MRIERVSRFLLLFLMSCTLLFSQEATRLTAPDINRLMKEILAEHVATKEMTPNLLQVAVQQYIDQFDADRLYLLDSEVQPFLNLSPQETQTLLQQYNRSDFSLFTRLDETIQKAISRARSLRHVGQEATAALLEEAAQSKANDKAVDSEQPLPAFSKSDNDLKQRWHAKWVEILRYDIEHFGKEQVQTRLSQAIARLEENVRQIEDHYLYVATDGGALTQKDKEDLFATHILKALTISLDPHTSFFNDAEAFDMKAHLDKGFQGIGIVFAEGIDSFIVNDIIPNSPAARNNSIHPKDQIVAVNGQKLEGKSLEQVVELVRNHENHPITLLLRPVSENADHHVIEVTLVPELITLQRERVESSFEPFEDGIVGRITLYSFYESANGISSAQDVRQAIDELKTHGKLKGLVLDLRNNGGGYLTQAVKVAGLFISNGVVVISKYNDGQEHFYRHLDSDSAYSGPLIILTSRYTASAAEIVAQSLQDYGVALIVGDEHTYGKGTIQAQTVTDKDSSTYFKVTVGKYYTVSGKSPQIKGVRADIVVPGPYSQLPIGESYLNKHLETDSVPPAFDDTLSDIDPFVKNWYMRYYMPTLQHPTNQWKELVPELKKKSEQRLQQNREYQSFLERLLHPNAQGGSAGGQIDVKPSPEFKVDFQLNEAMAILKDMNLIDQAAVVTSH